MKVSSLIAVVLYLLLSGCNNSLTVRKSGLSIQLKNEKPTYSLADSIAFRLDNPKSVKVSKVKFLFDGKIIDTSNSGTLSLGKEKLGKQQIEAQIIVAQDTLLLHKKITIVNDKKPVLYTYEVINQYPHDINAYTQGLEFYEGLLYESTGLYGKSSLRKLDYKTGEILQEIKLSNGLFGEGLSILNNKIYQLTWRAGVGFIYNPETLKKIGSFAYGKSKEGWGLCNNGKKLYKSDGTEKIWTLNPSTLTEQGYIQCYTNKKKIPQINELEWANGKIYANQYQKNGVAIIDPENGAVQGVVDFTPLRKQLTQHEDLDVLNGIAYNPKTDTFFITGKNWDKLFEVKIIKK